METFPVDRGDDWFLYQSPFIQKERRNLVCDVNVAHKGFSEAFPHLGASLQVTNGKDTSGYSLYNVFALTSPSPYFYQLYRIFRNIVRLHLGDGPIWFESWMNVHSPETVLDWHGHVFDYHGYISIDPQDTTTMFKDPDYQIKNYPGQIYFGPGGRMHKVSVDSDFTKPRITLGFDIHLNPETPDGTFALLPLL